MADIDNQNDTDWNICCLCQSEKPEPLRHPYKKKQYHVGYTSLEENLLNFNETGKLPLGIDIRRLNDGTGIANTLLAKQAKYHHSCKCECSEARLQRKEAQKHKSEIEETVVSPKKTRSSFSSNVNSKEKGQAKIVYTVQK